MKTNLIIISSFCLMLLSSCEKTFTTVLDYDIPHTPIIGLQVEFDKDAGLLANISQTVSVTGFTQPSVISNAKSYLFENNILKDSFEYSLTNKLYTSNFNNFISNASYKITVAAPNFKSVEAEDIMPTTMKISTVEYTTEAREFKLFDNDTLVKFDEIKITFKDESLEKDYYKISVFYKDSTTYYSPNIISFDTDIDDGGFSDPLSGGAKFVGNPFNVLDLTFNGSKKTISFYIESGLVNHIDQKWMIELSHVSPNLYKYDKTKRLYEENDGNPFAEPVQIHNNVINGIGIFGLKKDTTLSF